jgi:hypothetical protein
VLFFGWSKAQIETIVAVGAQAQVTGSSHKTAPKNLQKRNAKHLMLNQIISRLSHLKAANGSAPHVPEQGPARIEVYPPALRRPTQSSSWQEGWQAGLRDWLQSAWPTHAGSALSTQSHWPKELAMTAQSSSPLSLVRREFVDSLRDIRTQQAGDLLGRIRIARSMRDLWHLRTEIYNVVSHHRDESEATYRLNRLNRFFPQRVGRPGMGQQAASAQRQGVSQ